MARTVEQIKTEIDTAIAADSNISVLASNTSNTAKWKLFRYVIALAIYTLEVLFDAFRVEIDAKSKIIVPGTSTWFAAKVLEFQYGDTLTLVNLVPQYAVVDETHRIIKRVSVVEKLGGCYIKVAKETSGVLTAITSGEKTALLSYLSKIKPAGIDTVIVGIAGDILDMVGGTQTIIYYDAQTDPSVIQAAYQAATDLYLKNFDFNGQFYLAKLEDVYQAIPNVVDVQMGQLTAQPSGGSVVNIGRVYNPVSGWLVRGSTYISSTQFMPV